MKQIPYKTWNSDILMQSFELIRKRKLIVVLDAGHGGADGGAGGARTKESTVVLAIALLAKTYLETFGYIVKLTRSTDVFVELGARAFFANQAEADIFISLHLNSFATKTAHGFESFIFNGVNVSAHTRTLQKCLHESIMTDFPLFDRGKKSANFAVLRLTHMPAVLLEYAFISNAKEEEFIIQEVDRAAKLTVQGINRYFGYSTPFGAAPVPVTPPKAPLAPAPELPTIEEEEEMKLNNTARQDIMRLNNHAVGQGIFKKKIATKAEWDKAYAAGGPALKQMQLEYNSMPLEDMSDSDLYSKFVSYQVRGALS